MSSDLTTEMGEVWVDRKIRQDPLWLVSASIFLFRLGVSEERLRCTSPSLVGNSALMGLSQVWFSDIGNIGDFWGLNVWEGPLVNAEEPGCGNGGFDLFTVYLLIYQCTYYRVFLICSTANQKTSLVLQPIPSKNFSLRASSVKSSTPPPHPESMPDKSPCFNRSTAEYLFHRAVTPLAVFILLIHVRTTPR